MPQINIIVPLQAFMTVEAFYMISILYGLHLYLLCDKYPKSISWFPCMTVGAFYMISSQHTTAALSLFLTTTKNTQLEMVLQLVFESLLLHLLQ